jgi:hypothetical protein
VTDKGARILARALQERDQLRDIGITLSDMTDVSCERLGSALSTCHR